MSLDQTKIPNLYKERTQLENGVWCLPDYSKDWGGEVNHNFELLDNLLNRKTLNFVFDGHLIGSFNGSENKTLEIPKTEVDVPKGTLTLRSGSIVLGVFDLKTNEEIDLGIPTGSLTLTVNGNPIGGFNLKNDATIDIPIPEVHIPEANLTLKLNDNILGTFNTKVDNVIDIPVDIPKGNLTLTSNSRNLGTFNLKNDLTIDIPVYQDDAITDAEIDEIFRTV